MDLDVACGTDDSSLYLIGLVAASEGTVNSSAASFRIRVFRSPVPALALLANQRLSTADKKLIRFRNRRLFTAGAASERGEPPADGFAWAPRSAAWPAPLRAARACPGAGGESEVGLRSVAVAPLAGGPLRGPSLRQARIDLSLTVVCRLFTVLRGSVVVRRRSGGTTAGGAVHSEAQGGAWAKGKSKEGLRK